MRWAGATVIAMLAVTVALTACSSRPAVIDPTSRTMTPSPSGAGSVTEWLAVLRVEAVVDRLQTDTDTVKAIAGGSIVVSPVACFEGLPVSIDPDVYLLGLVAPTKEELDPIVSQVRETIDRPVVFEGQVRTMCVD